MKFTFLIILLCFGNQAIQACSCDCDIFVTNLCRFLHEEPANFVEARVINQDSTLDGYAVSWQLEFIENYGYSNEMPDTFWIAYLADGFSCDQWMDFEAEIALNDTLILALVYNEFDNVYQLNICLSSVFYVDNGKVFGRVHSFQYEEDYPAFKSYITDGYLTDFDCVECSCYYCGFSFYSQFGFETFCSSLKGTSHFEVGRYQIIEKHEHHLLALPIELLSYSWDGWETQPEPIKIWGTLDEDDCRKSIEVFEVGKEYILNLYELQAYDRKTSQEQAGDFRFMDCGVQHLDIEEEMVVGPINEHINSLPYESFAEVFTNASFYYDDDCSWWTVGLEVINESSPLKIYPNPTSDFLFVECEKSFQVLSLIDANGSKYQVEENNTRLDLSALSDGLYFLEIEMNKQIVIEKVLLIH